MSLKTRTRFAALIAALLSASGHAQNVRIEPMAALPSAPVPALSAPASPASLAAAPLSAAPALAPVFAAPSAALQAAPAAAAPSAAPVALAAPALEALPAASIPAAGRRDGGATSAQAAASPDAAASEGRALFDQAAAHAGPIDDLVRASAKRPLSGGVFIQQEHEGSLLAPDGRDSSGNVFKYYRPIEMRPDLMAETKRGVVGLDKVLGAISRAFQIRGRGTPEGTWRAWPLSAKLDYLDRLEKAVAAERGPEAAWDHKVSLILERAPGAPDFVTEHPHMEAPPRAHQRDVGARFLQPEIVSAADKPSFTVEQALGRARTVIADTGHAGVQFHVFVKAEPSALLAQIDALDGVMQLVNDALFSDAAAESEQNMVHPSLLPWHRGRSERVRTLLEAAAAHPSVPSAEDPDSEKHAFVGLRYWGLEDGKAVISFELRGVSIPFKRAPGSSARGFESVEMPKRDYTAARTYLTFLTIYAESLARGKAPSVGAPSVVLDRAAAEDYLRARARALGVPDGAYDGLEAFSRRLTRAEGVPASYLLPYAASAPDSAGLRALADETIMIAARLKAEEDAGRESNLRQNRYLFWGAYAGWAKTYGAAANARLERLVRAAAATGR
jgi:hypothetical protein